MKIAYIAGLLHLHGIDHYGRTLTRHLQSEYKNVVVCGAIAPPDSMLWKTPVRGYVLSVEHLHDIDVVYMEGGWTDGAGTDRFPVEVALDFVSNGGLLIVADIDRHTIKVQAEALRTADHLFGAVPSGQYLHDEGRETYGTRYFTDQMWVSDRCRSTLDGIDSLVGDSAVELQPIHADIAATGNASSTRTMSQDTFTGSPYPMPWATINTVGTGHAVLIGANVSYDAIIEACPDNARWISNLITSLTDETKESKQWLLGRSPKPRANNLAYLLRQAESQQLERKSSFLVPTDPGRRDTPRVVLQRQVGKSIAALANTDGGHVLIGVGDDIDQSPIGLRGDFAALKGNRDEFELALAQYVINCLEPTWETLGLVVQWIDTDNEESVAVIEVPKQPADISVLVKEKGKAESIYVRRGTRTDELKPKEILEWSAARRRR